jgi:hypothetical protein
MKLEAEFQAELRKQLHRPLANYKWVVEKVQDAFKNGQLDLNFVFNGSMAKCETKYIPAWPVKPGTEVQLKPLMSKEQRTHADEWTSGGGLALLLIGIEDRWFMWEWPAVPISLTKYRLTLDPKACALGGVMRDLTPIVEYVQTWDQNRWLSQREQFIMDTGRNGAR